MKPYSLRSAIASLLAAAFILRLDTCLRSVTDIGVTGILSCQLPQLSGGIPPPFFSSKPVGTE